MTIKTLGKAVLGAMMVSVWALAPGCGTSIGGFCNKLCDCQGCSDPEREDCVDDLEDQRRLSENEGCGDKFSDYLSCIDSELTCQDGDVDADGCESESKVYFNCISGSSETGPG